MKARTVLALAALAAGGLCLFVFFGLEDSSTSEEVIAGAAVDERMTPHGAGPEAGAEIAPTEAALGPSETASTTSLRTRIAGIPPPPADALVAVHGRVVDAVTGEPVQGITLGLLSRRPRTCTVRTDAKGLFATGAELSSGVVTAAHVPDPDSAPFSARWEIEPASFLAAAPGSLAAGKEIRLAARAPDRELEVDVRLPDGGAAAGASVSLTWGGRDAAGRFLAQGRSYEDTDDYGRARFALFGSETWERSFRIEAEHKGSLASDVLSLDPPFGRVPPVLGLHPGGTLRVRAMNDEGRPLACVSLWIEAQDESGTVRGRAGDTDARGECVFTALRSGCYSLSAMHPSTGEEIRREIELARGAVETVDLRLTLEGLALRLSGTVTDELGFPLPGVAVRAQAAGESPISSTTAEGGRFEFWGRRCDEVLFTPGGGFLDDRYDPHVVAVPCGTAGLVVRRLAKLAESSWPFEVRDNATGDPVRMAFVTLYHGDLRGSSPALKNFTANGGLVQVTFKLRDDLSYAVDAPGYLREQGALADLLEAGSHQGFLRVELDRGFDRSVEVKDRITRRGIGGASLSAGALILGRADEHGAVHLQADQWPASIRVECSGYAPLSWDPASAGFPGDVIWLDPLRAGK